MSPRTPNYMLNLKIDTNNNNNIINWTKEEIRQVDAKTIKLLTTYGMLCPTADINRLYDKGEKGSRCLRQIDYNATSTKISIIKAINVAQNMSNQAGQGNEKPALQQIYTKTVGRPKPCTGN